MIIKAIQEEDFVNYKKPSMFIAFPHCTFKCETECGLKCCHNSSLIFQPSITIEEKELVKRYMDNPITHAIVCGGMEPLDSWEDLQHFIIAIREKTTDDVVVYTGFKESEIIEQIQWLQQYPNIYLKVGRFIPNKTPQYDKVLGVKLASPNQYGVKIS